MCHVLRAAARGLGDIKVTWAKFAGGNVMNEALLSGSLDFAAAVDDRALILEKGSIRWEGPFATLEADEAIRRVYLTV